MLAMLPMLAMLACAEPARRAAAPAHYVPRSRDITITTVPFLTKEMQAVYPFLKQDFGQGGVLAGKEVYGFQPSSVTVVEGDTVRLTLVNPEDDLHWFVMQGLAVKLLPQSVQHAVYVARRAGIFRFSCAVPSHLPYMYGELVVLPAGVGAEMEGEGP
jgi:uncharacterized cupredoxin-like copper-binding protein